MAAEVFALTVFLCGGLLQLRPAPLASITFNLVEAEAHRFFAIAKRLSVELQMILCHGVVGSGMDCILSKDSEAAFKNRAKIDTSASK